MTYQMYVYVHLVGLSQSLSFAPPLSSACLPSNGWRRDVITKNIKEAFSFFLWNVDHRQLQSTTGEERHQDITCMQLYTIFLQ